MLQRQRKARLQNSLQRRRPLLLQRMEGRNPQRRKKIQWWQRLRMEAKRLRRKKPQHLQRRRLQMLHRSPQLQQRLRMEGRSPQRRPRLLQGLRVKWRKRPTQSRQTRSSH